MCWPSQPDPPDVSSTDHRASTTHCSRFSLLWPQSQRIYDDEPSFSFSVLLTIDIMNLPSFS